MSVRQDWIRLTGTIHYLLHPHHFETRNESLTRKTITTLGLQFIAGNVAVSQDRRLLAEIERRRGRVVANNVRNQLR